MLAELTITSETMIFIGTVVAAVISILLYLGSLDRRITILESKLINKDEFYEKIEMLKDDMRKIINEEIKNCRSINED